MYKKIFSVFVLLLIFSMGFALAALGEPDNRGNNGSGNQGGVGTTNEDSGNASGNGTQYTDQNMGQDIQNQNRVRVQDGTHVVEGGQMLQIQNQANSRVRIETGGVSAECNCEMEQEQAQNRTRLYAKLSNGQNAEIKVMPDTASERALERLRLKVCSSENNCSIELKEVGKSEQEKQLAYEMQIQRHSRILGIFQKKMQVRAEVSAENGEVLNVDKPWWAFISSEPAEE